jgi:hypothetical protein
MDAMEPKNRQNVAAFAALVMFCTGCASKNIRQTEQYGGSSVYQSRAFQNRAVARPTVAAPERNEPVENTFPGAVGVWSGSNGEERITVKFGANGSLILTNASGSEAGRWSGSRNSFRITIGEFSGSFILLDSNTASFTLGDSHVEMRRRG